MSNQAHLQDALALSLRTLLDAVRAGEVSPDAAETQLRDVLDRERAEPLGFAKVDHDRATRQGFPEVVFGQGKTPDQIAALAASIVRRGHSLLVTRTDRVAFHEVAKVVPGCHFHEQARIIERRANEPRGQGVILVAAAGTSDIPVAEEAAISAEVMGNDVDRLYDVGVAGLHRLLAHLDRITAADAIVVLAGMEGALASVIGGLTGAPVIAVPTSVGYGTSLDGVTALLAMHASCASGVTVVGIDNGFGAACAVARMFD